MDFGRLAQLSVGLAAFIGGLWLVLQIIKTIKRNGNAKHAPSSGEKSTDYWTLEIGRIMEQKLEQHESKVREIIRDELRQR